MGFRCPALGSNTASDLEKLKVQDQIPHKLPSIEKQPIACWYHFSSLWPVPDWNTYKNIGLHVRSMFQSPKEHASMFYRSTSN